MSSEIWKVVEGYPEYEVSNRGRARSTFLKSQHGRKAGTIVLKQQNYKGKMLLVITKNKVASGKVVARLVYAAFVGPIPHGFAVYHKNLNSQDNSVENLWVAKKNSHVVRRGDANRAKLGESIYKVEPEPLPIIDNPHTEEWRMAPGLEDYYEVSNFGLIRRVKEGSNTKVGLAKKGKANANGYPSVCCSIRSVTRQVVIHRVVAEAFLGKPLTPDLVINHKNGNKLDNRVTNLEWVTQGENRRHAVRYGLFGKKHGRNEKGWKLTRGQANEIRRLYATGTVTQRELGKKFGVRQSGISRIILNRDWKQRIDSVDCKIERTGKQCQIQEF